MYGNGFGNFLPRHHISDNAWALTLVELGLLGAFVFGALFPTALFSAIQVVCSSDPQLRMIGRTMAASVFSLAVVFAFFDAMSFPIAAGTTFLLFGLCGAVPDRRPQTRSPARRSRRPDGDDRAERVRRQRRFSGLASVSSPFSLA